MNTLSLSDIVTNVVGEFGIQKPDELVGSTSSNQSASNLVKFAEQTCEELARRVDWGDLKRIETFAGTGAVVTHDLPTGFSRLSQGDGVFVEGLLVRGGLSDDEWLSLTVSATADQPRYFHLRGSTISFWPHMPDTSTAKLTYFTENYNGSNSRFVLDADVPSLPHNLIEKGIIWRWRRHVGQAYEDHLAEYEAVLGEMAAFDVQDRTP